MEEEIKSIKKLCREKTNIILLLILGLYLMFFFYIVYDMRTNIKIRKKIDHRYFNITKSIEDVHNVDIDTKDGHVIRY